MNCRKARILCQELLDNELKAKARDALLAHLRSCPACMSFYRESQKLKELIASLPTPQLSSSFNSSVLKEIEQRERKALRPLPLFHLARRAIFLLLPLFLLIFLLFNIHWRKPTEVELFDTYNREHLVYTLQNPLISEDSAVKILLVSGQQ